MIQSIWKITIRNIFKNKVYSLINVLGLTLGFTALILVYLFIKYEVSWDKHNENYNQIYRIQRNYEGISFASNGNNISPHTRAVTAKLIGDNFPEFKEVTIIKEYGNKFLSSGKKQLFTDKYGICADYNFFNVFSYEFVEGNKNTSLNNPLSIVLSERQANILFPKEKALGKTIIIEKKYNFTVTGVYRNIPNNSTLRPNYILSLSSLKIIEGTDPFESWSGDFMTFVLLKKGTDTKLINTKIKDLFSDYNNSRFEKLKLYPLSVLYLSANDQNDYLFILELFGIIGMFILIMSAFNYINLTAAKASTRYKEVAVKKIVGSNRSSLFFQFMIETILFATFALVLAFCLTKLVLPVFNSIIEKEIEFSLLSDFSFILSSGLILLLVGVLAGIFPSVLLSSQKILILLKGVMFGKKANKLTLQKTLVLFQFAIAVLLIGITLFITFQVKYLINKDLGFNKENILYSKINSQNTSIIFEDIRNRLLAYPEIIEASIAQHIPFISYAGGTINWEGSQPDDLINVRYGNVDYDFLKTFEIKLLSGRDFSRDLPSDVGKSCIINETAAKNFGWENPIGKRINNNRWQIIGVVKDYHFKDMHNAIEPAALVLYSGSLKGEWTYSFRILPGKINEAKKILTKEFEDIFPNDPFEFTELNIGFMNENVMRIYKSLNKTILFFTICIIFLAVFGLLGLVSFNIVRRIKEIGIRKISGSSSYNIFIFLSKEYLMLLFSSLIIAWPGIYLVHYYFPGSYKIPIHPVLFILSVIIILIIVFLTTSYQTYKVATRNPAETLKYE